MLPELGMNYPHSALIFDMNSKGCYITPADALSRNPVLFAVNAAPIDFTEEISKVQEDANMFPGPFEHWPDHWFVKTINGFELVVDTRGPQPRPVVPDLVARLVFTLVQNLSHPGVKATTRLISARFVWPNMAKDVKMWLKSYPDCQASKISKHHRSSFQPFAPPLAKFAHVHIVGPLLESEGFLYLLTVLDRFSRWSAAISLRNVTALSCARAFAESWVQNFGIPAVLTSNRGRHPCGRSS